MAITAKATALLTDHDHVFCTARIYTDRRDVFGSKPEAPIVGAVIFHTLKLNYFSSGGKHENFYIVLDSDDIASLRSVLDRAGAKEDNIRSQLRAENVRCLNPEKSAS